MLKLPVCVPEAVGWKATETVHPTLDASDGPHVFAVMAKLAVTAGVCSMTVTPPVLEIVMFCTALVAPTFVAE
jgi:hypothetical protein